MKRFLGSSVWIALIPLVAGCSPGGDAAKPAPETVRPPVAVETAVAAPGTIVTGVDVTGSLAPKFEVDVKSEVTGLIREVYVTEGVRVEKGAPLAKIDPGSRRPSPRGPRPPWSRRRARFSSPGWQKKPCGASSKDEASQGCSLATHRPLTMPEPWRRQPTPGRMRPMPRSAPPRRTQQVKTRCRKPDRLPHGGMVSERARMWAIWSARRSKPGCSFTS
jgi:hypothetical protein